MDKEFLVRDGHGDQRSVQPSLCHHVDEKPGTFAVRFDDTVGNQLFVPLRSFLYQAVMDKRRVAEAEREPNARVHRQRGRERKRTIEPSILEPAEIAAILRELDGVEPVRTAFLIAAVMGMRRGEIFGLKWGDVDFGRAILHVRRSYVDGVVGPTKTDSSRRPLPIPEQALNVLAAWKRKSKYAASEDWVFASEFHFGKQPLWPGTLWQRNVTPAIKQTGITKPKLGWHTLRRSFASLLLSEGASLRVSMELMRHSTPEMTLGTYAQTVGDEKREASSKVELRVFPKGKVA
jgi:integrase